MFVIYLLLGGLFSWLAIKSFSAAFGGSQEDEHALYVDKESDEFDDDIESEDGFESDDEWEDEEESGEDELWKLGDDQELTNTYCPEELTDYSE